MSFLHSTLQVLSDKGARTPLGFFATQVARRLGRGVIRIFNDNGVWVHETCAGYFAYPKPCLRLDLSRLNRFTRSVFWWGYQPSAGDTIVDVGAGVGEEALIFSEAVGEHGKVFCIEAHPQTFHCLEKLVHYNQLSNVVPIHQAIGETALGATTIENSARYLSNRSNSHEGIAVLATTLDRIVEQQSLDRIHFLKMNIESAERAAVRGMQKTLQKTEVVCVSCHDFLAERGGHASMRTKKEVLEFLRAKGFAIRVRLQPSLPAFVRDQVWGYNTELLEAAAS